MIIEWYWYAASFHFQIWKIEFRVGFPIIVNRAMFRLELFGWDLMGIMIFELTILRFNIGLSYWND